MSDHRFHLKGTFSIYGRDYPFDMSLNWHADFDGIDHRITDFFLKVYRTARREWDAELSEVLAARERAAQEETERKELARLKAKYETP